MATNRAGVRSYMSNLGKSILYSSKAAVATTMPTLSGTIESNSEAVRSGVSYVKETLTNKSSTNIATNSLVSSFLKDVDAIKSKAFEEIKTGKFVDFDKKMDTMFGDMGLDDSMGIDWGDGASDPFAIFDDPDEFSSIDPLKSINAIKTSTKVSEIGSTMRTKALMETVTDASEKSASYIAKTNAKLQSISMAMQSQMHIEVLKGIGDANKLLTTVVEFNNTTVVDHFNKQLTFYDNVLEELRAIKESVKKEAPRDHRGKQTSFDSVLTGSGINFAEYGKQIKKNFSNMIAETPLGMMSAMSQMGGSSIMGDLKKNPMQFVSQLLAAALIPGSVKTAMGQLDTSLSGLISATAMKINSGKNSPNWLKSTMSSLFGLDLSYKTGLDMSAYNKTAVTYNAKSDKALTEVLPTLLSHILSAVSGSDKVAHYDYNRGKFVDGKSVFKETKDRITHSKNSDFLDIRENMKRSLSTLPGGTSDEMMKDLDAFMDYMTHNFYNPLKSTSASNMASRGLKLSDPRVYNALRAAFMNMPKHLQNSAPSAGLKARTSMTGTLNHIERELFESGLSSAYSGLGDFKGPAAQSVSKSGQVTSLLRDIKNILIDGIFVYGNTTDKATMNALHGRMKKNKTNMANVATKTATQKVGDHVASHGTLNAIMDTPFDKLQETMAKNSFISQSQTESKFFSSLLGEKDVMKKMRMIKDNVTSPTRMITGIIGRMDSMIYRIIYGKQPGSGDEGDDAPKTGIFGKMTDALNKGIDKSLLFIDKKILSPLHETFFGEEGLFTKFMDSFDPFIDKMKKSFGTGVSRFSKYLIGDKTAKGIYTGGAFSDIGNMFVDFGNSARNLLTGGGYEKSDGTKVAENKNNVFGYIKSYSKSLFDSIKDGLFGERKTITKPDGTIEIVRDEKGGMLTGVIDSLKSTANVFTSLFTTKEGESPEDAKKTVGEWQKELKGFLPKGMAGGFAGMVAGALLPGGPILGAMLGSTLAFAGHSQKFRNYLFGDDETGKEGLVPKKYVDGFKKHFPSMAAGGVLGMLGSVVLPGGPLLGLTLGSSIAFASKSEKVQEFLFGKVEDGKTISEGLLGPEFKDKMKKVLPSMGAGGLLGVAGSLVLPGGPLLGLTLGSAIGFASKSERVQEFLFGKTDEKGNVLSEGLIPNSVKEKLKAAMPKAMAGGLAGALSGAVGFLTPGGPLVGALIGATLSVAGTSDRVKNFLFGEEDPDTHKRKGGMFGQVRDFMNKELFEPFKSWRKKKGVQIQDWFQNAISKPFQEALTPFKKAMGVIGDKFRSSFVELKDAFTGAFNRVFEKSVGMPLGELVKKHITDPMKNMLNKLFNAVGKGLSKILTSPITFMTAFANSVLEKEGIDPKGLSKEEGKKTSAADKTRDAIMTNLSQSVQHISKAVSGNTLVTPQGRAQQLPMGTQLLALPAPSTVTTTQVPQTEIQQKIADAANHASVMSEVSSAIKNGSTTTSDGNRRNRHGIDQPFLGQIDLTKYYAKVGLMESHLRKIKDEVSGQLNGVGWNLEYIANILTDKFGKPSKMPTEIAKRGNVRRRGLLGTIFNIIKSPFQMIGTMARAVILKPFQMLYNNVNKIVTGIGKTVGKAITTLVKLPFTIVRNAVKVTGHVISGVVGAVKMIGPTIQKSIKLTFDTIGHIVNAAGKVLTGALTGVGNVLAGVGKGIADSIGIISKFATTAIPMLTKGIFNALSLVGSTILKLGNFAKDILVNSTKAIASIFKIPGFGKKAQKVEVVGGKLDSVTTVKEVHTIYHIHNGEGASGVIGGISNVGQKLNSRFRSVLSSIGARKGVNGSHATGLDIVPYDGYVAKLHKGEMVVPSHQANKIRGMADGKRSVTGTGIANDVHGVMTDGRKTGFWRRIGRGMKTFISGLSRPEAARIGTINATVQRVHDQSSYDEATLGMLHQIAINTMSNGEDKKKSSLLDSLLGLLPAALAAINALKKAIPKAFTEVIEALTKKGIVQSTTKSISNLIARMLEKLGIKVGTKALEETGEHAAKKALQETSEHMLKRSGQLLLGEGAEKAAFQLLGDGTKTAGAGRVVMDGGVEIVQDASKRSTSRLAQEMRNTTMDLSVNDANKYRVYGAIDITPMKADPINVVKQDSGKVINAIKTFFTKVFDHSKIKRLIGPNGAKITKDILTKLGPLFKRPEFISKMLAGITKGAAKIGISTATLGVGEVVFAAWNLTTALVHRGDAATLFNVYESDVTPKMRLVASVLKTLLGVSYIFIFELLNIVVTELTGGKINVTKMIANSIYNIISDDETYADLTQAQFEFEEDAAAAGKSLSDWNNEKNARFEEKLWRGTKKVWNASKPVVNKVLDAATPVGMFRSIGDMRNTNKVRDTFGLNPDQKVNFRQRIATGSGSFMERMSFGLIDGGNVSRGLYGASQAVGTGIKTGLANTGKFFSNLGGNIKDGANDLWNSDVGMTVRNITSGTWNALTNLTSGFIDGLAAVNDAIGERIKNEIKKLGEWVSKKWDDVVVKRVDIFISGFQSNIAKLSEFWTKNVSTPFNDFMQGVREKIAGITKPVEEFFGMFKNMWDAVKNFAVDKVKDITGIDISDGVFKGVGDAAKNTWNKLWGKAEEGTASYKAVTESSSKSFGDKMRDTGSKIAQWISGKPDGSHAAGLDNVPFDGYKAILHKGEMVVPGQQANALRMAAGLEPVSLGYTPAQTQKPNVNNMLASSLADKVASVSTGYGPRISNLPSKLTTSDSDEAIRKEFGYVLSAPRSDFTIADIRMVKALCQQYGVNPHLWLALVETESSFNSKARSGSSTATGWGQVLKSTGRYIYEDLLKLGPYNHDTMATNKEINARMSIYYLGTHLKKYTSAAQALQRYNGGELGAEYSNRVASKLLKNSGLQLGQIVNPAATGINTYDSSASSYDNAGADNSNTPEQVTSMAGALGLLSKASAGALTQIYGVDIDNLMTSIPTIFALADPFAKLPDTLDSENAGGGYRPDAALAGIASMSAADTVKAKTYAGMLKSKYPNIFGDVNMHDFLAARISKLARDKGKSVTINSGWRSPETQQGLINDWYRKNPGKSDSERRRWVADVGSSRHELGLAADMSGWIKSISAGELARYGLHKPMANEDWHFEPIETRGMTTSQMRNIVGMPFAPAPGLSSFVKPGYNSMTTMSPSNQYNQQPSWNQPNPMLASVGYGIGDGQADVSITGAPSAATYSAKASLAARSIKSSINPNDDVVVKLLTIIAEHLGTLVDLTDEYRQFLMAVVTGKGGSSTPTVAIVNSGSSSSTTPLNSPTTAKKSNKRDQVKAILRETM